MIPKLAEQTFWHKYVTAPLNYGEYLFEHKKNVFKAGGEIDVPLGTRIFHDYSKFSPKNYWRYSQYWFGEKTPEVTNKFRESVQNHYNAEGHHNDKIGAPKSDQEWKESVVDWYSVYAANEEILGRSPIPFKVWWAQKRMGFTQLPQSVISSIDLSLM